MIGCNLLKNMSGMYYLTDKINYIGKEVTGISKNNNVWMIPDMYWPEITSKGHYVSHESVCVLNTGSEVCDIKMTLYFEDRSPISLTSKCLPKRTKHIRMDQAVLENGDSIPKGLAYSAKVECSVPVVVQYTRVDTTQNSNSIMTTMAYRLDDQ